MGVPKGSGFRVVTEYRAVYQLTEQVAMPIPMPGWEELGSTLEGAVTGVSSRTPKLVPQEFLKATA